MVLYNNPSEESWKELCIRPSSADEEVLTTVRAVLERVRCNGDRALCEITEEIEGRPLSSIAVSEADIAKAVSRVSDKVKRAVESAAANIEKFHAAQMPQQIDIETVAGVRCIQRPLPIERVGLYIPAGTAPLFSTVLMLAIPARIAGCREVVLCTPADPSGRVSDEVLYAARYCGIERIYSIGGAQAIAAMAYGTETVCKVDKIFGPGNRYVTSAKQILNGNTVSIDMPAGPSEVMVIADESARADFVASDLLSQAEHGRDSQVILLTDSENFAAGVSREVKGQLERLGRKSIAAAALENSRIIVFNDWDRILRFANMYAPEHLIVSTVSPWTVVDGITAAGSVFVGSYTPESAGDYASGTNHTLPTLGWARSFSGVNLESFMRRMTIQQISREGLEKLSDTIITMAEAEGLDAHAAAVKIRLDCNDD